MKPILLIVAAVVCLVGVLGQLQSKALRSASLAGGKHQLRLAVEDLARTGQITNYPTSGFHVSPFTNAVMVGGRQYDCIVVVTGGWGYGGGSLAMTTNREFLWLDPVRGAKVIPDGYRPSVFSARY